MIKDKIIYKDVRVDLQRNELSSSKDFKIYLQTGKGIFIEVGYFYVHFNEDILKKDEFFYKPYEDYINRGFSICLIEIFYIEEEYRKQGIGRIALDKLEEQLLYKFNTDSIFLSPYPTESKGNGDVEFLIWYRKLINFYKSCDYYFREATEFEVTTFPIICLYEKDLKKP